MITSGVWAPGGKPRRCIRARREEDKHAAGHCFEPVIHSAPACRYLPRSARFRAAQVTPPGRHVPVGCAVVLTVSKRSGIEVAECGGARTGRPVTPRR